MGQLQVAAGFDEQDSTTHAVRDW